MNFTKLAVLTSFSLFTLCAKAELLELSFIDTLGETKKNSPTTQHINPASNITFSLSGGLGRKVGVIVKNNSGAVVANATSAHITVSDLLVVNDNNYYGKTVSIPKLGEGEYTVSAQLLEFNGTIVASDEFTYTVDVTAPIVTGALGFSVVAFYTGDDKAFSSQNFSNIRLSGISDNVGVAKARAVAKTASTDFLSMPIGFDAATGDAVITGYPSAILPVDQSTYTIGIEIYDLAGNKTLTSKEYMVDNVLPPIDFSDVWNPTTNKWDPYVSGMTVHANPAKFRLRVAKADHVAHNNSLNGWYTPFPFVEGDYAYRDFTSYRPISSTYQHILTKGGRAYSARQYSLNYVLADGIDESPQASAAAYYRDQDNIWHNTNQLRTSTDLTVTAIRINAKLRNYEQLGEISGGGSCVIPAGASTCVIETNYTYNADRSGGKGYTPYAYFLKSSVGGSFDGRFNAHLSYFYTYWDFNKSAVESFVFGPKTLDVVVLDNDRVSDWRSSMWHTNGFTAIATNKNTGEVTHINRNSLTVTTYNQYAASFDLSALYEGSYMIDVLLSDSYGNKSTKRVNDNFVLDNSGPSIDITESGIAVPSSIVGLEGLLVALSDPSQAILTALQLQGGPTSSIVNLAWRNGNTDEYLLEYPKIFPSLAEGEDYTLTVNATDSFGNKTTKSVTFNYMPNDLINVGNIQTLAINKGLKLPDNTPLTVIKSAPLRTEEGELARGNQKVDVTLRSDADYSVVIAGVTIVPGETKSMTINVDAHDGALNIPVYPAENGVSGKAAFLIGLPFIEGVWCEAGYHVKDDYCLKVITKTPVSNTCPAGYNLNTTLKICTQSMTKPFIALNN
jgi:hypothetical protein